MRRCFNGLIASWSQNRRFALWSTVILAFIIRFGAMLALTTYEFSSRREHWNFGHEWGRIAKWLIERGMFSLDGREPTAGWDPFYVFIIVPFFQVFGTHTTSAAVAVLVFQIVVCALSTWVVFVLAEKLYGPFEARAAALLFALYPASVFFGILRVGPASLIILLTGGLFLAALALQSSQQRRFAIAGGVLLGLLVLTSSKTLSLVLVVPLWLVLAGKGTYVSRLGNAMLLVGVAILTVMPWSIRNAYSLGHFSLSRADFSYHLWRGNNPDATGYWYTSPAAPDGMRNRRLISQAEYRQRALRWIAQHPKAFAQLTLKRMKYFWYKITESRRLDAKRKTRDGVHTGIFMTVLGLALVGLFRSRGYWRGVSLLLLFMAVYPLVFYLTHITLYRYRYPIEPFLLILAGHGLHELWRLVSRWRRSGEIPERLQLEADESGVPIGD